MAVVFTIKSLRVTIARIESNQVAKSLVLLSLIAKALDTMANYLRQNDNNP